MVEKYNIKGGVEPWGGRWDAIGNIVVSRYNLSEDLLQRKNSVNQLSEGSTFHMHRTRAEAVAAVRLPLQKDHGAT